VGLRWTLVALGVYVGLFGLLFLLAQDLAAALLEMELRDPVAFRQWGVALLMLALLAALLAADPIRYRRLLAVALLGLPLDTLVLGYDLLSGASTLRQHGLPLLLNAVLFALLVTFYPREGPAEPATPLGRRVIERLRERHG
jgi:hypothetical protein